MPRAWLAVPFFLLAACGAAEAPPPGATPRRLLVVGWDGASFRALEPLLAAGALPNLAGLLARGSRATLESTRIPISAAAWATATTGKGPGETGVFAFHEPHGYALELVSARSNHAAPLWRLLSGRGVPSFVLGVPVTYPPEPILGTLVCGMLAPRAADFAWPRGLADELRARGYLPDLDPWLEEREPTWDEAKAQLDLRESFLRERLARADWRLAWVVFKELDVLSHFSYGVDFAARVAPIYARLDALLGTLLQTVGPESDVILLSDHGFTTYPGGLNLHAWLVEHGFAARRAGASDAPLPQGPFARRFADEHAQRLAELDLGRTQAFAWACEGNFGSVRLNLAGREPAGIVEPDEAEGVLVRIEAELFAQPGVAEVWRAEELLPGPHREALPDIVFATRPEVQVFAERGRALAGEYPAPVADHDLFGIFAAAGPHFAHVAEAPGAEARRLTLLDIAPLALHVLGEPVPLEMRGRVPLELLRASGEVVRVPESAFAAVAPRVEGAPYTPEEIEALERGLEALGYAR